MEENNLIKTGNNELIKIGNVIAITSKLISTNDRKAISDLFCKNPLFFFKTMSWYYGLSHTQIDKFKGRWDFQYLSKNENLVWSKELIEKYKNKWLWEYGLSYNKSLPWSPELIAKYVDKWDWYGIAKNKSLVEKEWFKKEYGSKIEPEVASGRVKEKIVSKEDIEEYINSLQWDRKALSSSPNLPWSEALLEEYIDVWDWATLSDSNWLPWSESLLDKFTEKWNWDNLSTNTSICWSEVIIEKYKYRWDWEYLFLNNSVHWNISLINKYKGLFILNHLKQHVDDSLVEFVLEMNT
jgi:hypothetical protein